MTPVKPAAARPLDRRPLSILHVIETLGQGGAEQALVNLLPTLVERGHRVGVVALQAPGTLAGALEAGGVAVHQLGLPHRWALPQAVRALRSVASDGVDVVHSHLYFADVYTGMVRAAGGPPCVSTFHNLEQGERYPRASWKQIRRGLHGLLLRRVFGARLAVSDVVGQHYRDALVLPDVTVVPNAVPTEKAATSDEQAASLRASLSIPDGHAMVLLPGRAVPEKGHRVLFEAAGRLAERGIEPVFVCAGGGPLEAGLARGVAARGLESQVRLLGAVPHTDLQSLMRVADVVVVPSLREGFGLVVAEAYVQERPVVASAVGGIPSLVRDGESGLLVPPGDAGALADAIARILLDPSFGERLASVGRDQVVATMSAETVATELMSVYESVLA